MKLRLKQIVLAAILLQPIGSIINAQTVLESKASARLPNNAPFAYPFY